MPPSPPPARMTIGVLCLLIAGISVGFWLFGMQGTPPGVMAVLAPAVGVLGGMAVVGPPLLLWSRYRERRRRRWGPGEVLWFATGTSAWLLWPPVVHARVRPPGPAQMGDASGMAAICFLYGTPLMALYVTLALLCGGWMRGRGRRRRRPLPWRERFGLILGLLWAATGAWVLFLIYSEKLK